VVVIGSWFNHDLPLGKSQSFKTGLRDLHPTWRVQGRWPDDRDTTSCLVGAALARAKGLSPGADLTLTSPAAAGGSAPSYSCRVQGVVEAGGAEDEQVLAPLAAVQSFAGEGGRVRRVEVSALTKPEDDFGRRNPSQMNPEEFERWSCSPYVSSIAYQIEQAIPGSVARPVYPVADTEGRILGRIASLMMALAIAALATACLTVASMMLATVIERRGEIGLFQSLGASRTRVAAIFLLEGSAIGVAGGGLGYVAGSLLAHRLGRIVFGSPAAVHGSLLPAVLLVALLVTWLGSAVPLARGLKVPAAISLRD
jgi:putative ABC transport system permease protein